MTVVISAATANVALNVSFENFKLAPSFSLFWQGTFFAQRMIIAGPSLRFGRPGFGPFGPSLRFGRSPMIQAIMVIANASDMICIFMVVSSFLLTALRVL